MDETQVKVYGYRWAVLGVFMFINITIQILWICYAPVTGEAAAFYHVSDGDIATLANVFLVVFIPLAIFASWAIDTWGIVKAVGLGAALMGVFGLLRGLITTSYTAALWFSIGIAVAQPFLLNAWTKVAARWFPQKERATAVGIVGVSSFAGILIGQVLTPYLVNSSGMAGMQLIYGVVAVVSVVAFFALIREHPPTPAGSEERAFFVDGLKQIFRLRDSYYLALCLFVGGGIFNGLLELSEPLVRPSGFSAEDAGLMAGMALVGGVIGSAALPAISEWLKMRKNVILAGFLLAVPGLLGLAFSGDRIVLMVSFFLIGIGTAGIVPVAFQYGAEITRPAPEATSNGIFWLATQLPFMTVPAMTLLRSQSGSYSSSLIIMIVLTIVSCALLLLLTESPVMRSEAAAARASLD